MSNLSQINFRHKSAWSWLTFVFVFVFHTRNTPQLQTTHLTSVSKCSIKIPSCLFSFYGGCSSEKVNRSIFFIQCILTYFDELVTNMILKFCTNSIFIVKTIKTHENHDFLHLSQYIHKILKNTAHKSKFIPYPFFPSCLKTKASTVGQGSILVAPYPSFPLCLKTKASTEKQGYNLICTIALLSIMLKKIEHCGIGLHIYLYHTPFSYRFFCKGWSCIFHLNIDYFDNYYLRKENG